MFVDADACPVKAEAERVAGRHKAACVMVSNGGIRPSAYPTAQVVVVPDGPDVADQWIAAHCGPGDVVVTSDIPLADRCLKAGAQVIQPNGEVLTPANIGGRLATRDLMQDLREAGAITGGPKPFSAKDRSAFLGALDRAVVRAQRDAGLR